jgi:hypothetical protein
LDVMNESLVLLVQYMKSICMVLFLLTVRYGTVR